MSTNRRPNFLVILADDLGWSDLGCCGGEIPTPHLDGLAADGLRLTGFCNNGLCLPTRASLLTGLYPDQAADQRGGLRETGCVTIAEVLRQAGYATFMSGKWHNGREPWQLPWNRGFERHYGLLCGSSNYFNPGLPRAGQAAPAHKRPGDTRPWGIDGEIVHPYTPDDPDFYATDAFTDAAVRFLADHRDDRRPFFGYLAYTAPHFPIQARADDIARHQGRYLAGWDHLRAERFERLAAAGLSDDSWRLSAWDHRVQAWSEIGDGAAWDRKMAVYAAMVESLDRGVGRVLDALAALGRADDTLVLFLSDNGGCAQHLEATPGVAPGPVDSYATVDAPWANLSNTPFRLYKTFLHEGGIATPLVVRWPGRIAAPGGVSPAGGHVVDLLPTLLDAAGASYPERFGGEPVRPPEGRSLLPVLAGAAPDLEREMFWDLGGCRAVRRGGWKLVTQGPARRHFGVDVEPGREDWELFDLATDRSELRDLARVRPELVRELAADWDRWHDRCAAGQGDR